MLLWRAAHEFNKAADLYSLAIEKNPADPTLWCNRAYTRIKLEEHGYGLSDASTSRPARALALVRYGAVCADGSRQARQSSSIQSTRRRTTGA